MRKLMGDPTIPPKNTAYPDPTKPPARATNAEPVKKGFSLVKMTPYFTAGIVAIIIIELIISLTK